MAVTAKSLSRSGARGKILEGFVREQLQIIDDKLLHADRTWGRNVMSYDLPDPPLLPGLNKTDAQRFVYSSILRSLDEREFEVGIFLGDANRLFVAWATDLTREEVDAMNSVIREKRILENQISKFIKGDLPGREAGPRQARGAAREAEPKNGPPKVHRPGERSDAVAPSE